MKLILECGSCECRWPVGTCEYGHHLFCGEATPGFKRTYCDKHEALARAPTREMADSQDIADWFGGGKARRQSRGDCGSETTPGLDSDISDRFAAKPSVDRPRNEKWSVR